MELRLSHQPAVAACAGLSTSDHPDPARGDDLERADLDRLGVGSDDQEFAAGPQPVDGGTQGCRSTTRNGPAGSASWAERIVAMRTSLSLLRNAAAGASTHPSDLAQTPLEQAKQALSG
ncbi:hypothetical protein ABGB07_09930 [Micromonosporaceae bacterium B7E4]